MRIEAEYRRTPSDQNDDVAVQWTRLERGIDEAAGSISILDLEVGTSYDVRVRQVDEETGAFSDWSLWPGIVVEREDGTPPDVDQVRLTKNDCLTWEPLMEVVDLRGYLVRHATGADECWERAEKAHEGIVDGPPFVLCRVPKGRRTYLVKAIDWDGNESAAPAVLVADRGPVDDQAEFSVRTVSQSPAFSGTKLGGSVIADKLRQDVDPAVAGATPMFGCALEPWIPLDGASPMIQYDPDTSFFAPVWGGDAEWLSRNGSAKFFHTEPYQWIEYLWEFEVHCGEDGHRSVLTADVDVVATTYRHEPPWRLQYRRKCSEVFIPIDPFEAWLPADGSDEWIPTESTRNWRPWPGRLLGAEVGVYEFRLLVPGGMERADVETLSVSISSEPRVRHVTGLSIPALGGTRVSPGDAWRHVVVSSVRPVSVTAPVTVPVIDKSKAKGPAIQAYQDGVAVTALIDVELRGY